MATDVRSGVGGSSDGKYEQSESVLFISTRFSNLYPAVDTPEPRDVHYVCVFVCKCVLGSE